MKLDGKFMQAVALAALLPAAAMMAGCCGGDDASAGADNVISGEIKSRAIGDPNYAYGDRFIIYSKEITRTKNDLECVTIYSQGPAMSCNWDKANGLVPADPAP